MSSFVLATRLTAVLAAISGAALLAGCATPTASDAGDDHLDRVAHEHTGDTPVPAAAAAGSGPDILTQEIAPTSESDPLRGYLAWPSAAETPLPGIILLHEWWGLNDNIRTMARRFAAEGYIVLALDLYDGQVAETPAAARTLMMAARDDGAGVDRKLRRGYRFLLERAQATGVAAVGWCFGGGMSLRTALLLPDEVDAAVVYYGQLVQDAGRLASLDMPILGIFGGQDSSIPQADVERFQRTLESLGKDVTIQVYPDAGHAFANPSGTRYDAEAAEDAWKHTTVFLREHLSR